MSYRPAGQTGTCRYCSKTIALRTDGTIRGHQPPPTMRDRSWAMCPGTHQAPRAAS